MKQKRGYLVFKFDKSTKKIFIKCIFKATGLSLQFFHKIHEDGDKNCNNSNCSNSCSNFRKFVILSSLK